MSSFASNHVQSIIASGLLDRRDEPKDLPLKQSREAEELSALVLELQSPLDRAAVAKTLDALVLVKKSNGSSDFASSSLSASDREQQYLENVLTGKIAVGLYTQCLDICLQEASEADTEADWWWNIERSWRSIAWYLLATFPIRIRRCVEVVVQELTSRNIPLRFSSFSPRSIRQLFPPTLRPTALSAAFFPHLASQSHLLLTSPVELARQECKIRRQNLIEIRDSRAAELGRLLQLRREIDASIRSDHTLEAAVLDIHEIMGDRDSAYSSKGTVPALNYLYSVQLPAHTFMHGQAFASLRRPSRLTLLWPRLALLPPAFVLFVRLIYGNRKSIADYAARAIETVEGFWTGYVVEPLKGILDTVRTGGDEGMRIVSQEAVKADLDSLERMALSLSKEKLSYNDSQISELSKQIRQGDLTPVLKVYEEDIKSPLRSAISGTLIRSLLIQVQKAKVDLDQALSGIDKLLKSQELTFAFVGVAPSLVVVYGLWAYLRGVWGGGRGNSRLGGRRKRQVSWQAMRRIERLLVNSSHIRSEKEGSAKSVTQPGLLTPLTSGLLMISVSHLRSYAERSLPQRSFIREGFLEDVADLENPDLGRDEKQLVIERMWRSWGTVLGWHTVGGLHDS